MVILHLALLLSPVTTQHYLTATLKKQDLEEYFGIAPNNKVQEHSEKTEYIQKLLGTTSGEGIYIINVCAHDGKTLHPVYFLYKSGASSVQVKLKRKK